MHNIRGFSLFAMHCVRKRAEIGAWNPPFHTNSTQIPFNSTICLLPYVHACHRIEFQSNPHEYRPGLIGLFPPGHPSYRNVGNWSKRARRLSACEVEKGVARYTVRLPRVSESEQNSFLARPEINAGVRTATTPPLSAEDRMPVPFTHSIFDSRFYRRPRNRMTPMHRGGFYSDFPLLQLNRLSGKGRDSPRARGAFVMNGQQRVTVSQLWFMDFLNRALVFLYIYEPSTLTRILYICKILYSPSNDAHSFR